MAEKKEIKEENKEVEKKVMTEQDVIDYINNIDINFLNEDEKYVERKKFIEEFEQKIENAEKIIKDKEDKLNKNLYVLKKKLNDVENKMKEILKNNKIERYDYAEHSHGYYGYDAEPYHDWKINGQTLAGGFDGNFNRSIDRIWEFLDHFESIPRKLKERRERQEKLINEIEKIEQDEKLNKYLILKEKLGILENKTEISPKEKKQIDKLNKQIEKIENKNKYVINYVSKLKYLETTKEESESLNEIISKVSSEDILELKNLEKTRGGLEGERAAEKKNISETKEQKKINNLKESLEDIKWDYIYSKERKENDKIEEQAKILKLAEFYENNVEEFENSKDLRDAIRKKVYYILREKELSQVWYNYECARSEFGYILEKLDITKKYTKEILGTDFENMTDAEKFRYFSMDSYDKRKEMRESNKAELGF